MRRQQPAPAIGICLVLWLGCGDPTAIPNGDPQTDLDRARERWAAFSLVDYEMLQQRSCFCTATELMAVRVEGGVVVEVRPADGGDPLGADLLSLFLGVEDLFELIQEAIDEEVDRLDVRYDEDLGYPVELSIDRDFTVADEEISYDTAVLAGLR